jgi:glycosyltransferase involved in cell wall biosynthesis
MPQISAIIITYNEERNIGQCIQSLKGVADEIIVVDSYSTDRTIEISARHGAIVYQHAFDGYIQQKSYALTKSSFPHILSLDADEVLTKQLKQSILKVKCNWTHDGYYFNRLSNYCGKWIKHGSWYPSRKLRLFDKRKGAWGGVNPHDVFIMHKGASKKFLKGDLKHYPYYTVNEHIQQVNSFSDIYARSHFNIGTKTNIFWILVKPSWRFFRDYIIKFGFLDGVEGIIIGSISCYETFLKYLKLFQLQKADQKNSIEPQQSIDFNAINNTPTLTTIKLQRIKL